MSSQALAATAATILSLLFSYVPGFKTWYAPLSPTMKRLIMLAFVTLTAAGAFGLACAGWGDQLNLNLTCSHAGALGLLQSLIAALAANQATFLISPKPAGERSPSRRDKLNGGSFYQGELTSLKHISNINQEPNLPDAVGERYEKSRVRPDPEDAWEHIEHEPHPVKVRSIRSKGE